MKVCLRKDSVIVYYGSTRLVNYDHWTTADTMENAVKNLKKQLAKTEIGSIREWIYVDIPWDILEVE